MHSDIRTSLVLLARLIGMAFVVFNIATWIHRMTLVMEASGNAFPLLLVGVLSVGLFYWAYRVIWCPIRTRLEK